MRCEEARERLLTCDPAELAGQGDAPLARHVRNCGDCRAIADALVEGQRGLGRGLDRAAAAGADAREAADRALRAVKETTGGGEGTAGGEDGRRRGVTSGERAVPDRSRLRRWIAPLAAAAVLVLAVALPLGQDRDAEPWPPADRPGPAETALAVEAAGDRPVTVLRTSDPDVVLVWFHAQREESGR